MSCKCLGRGTFICEPRPFGEAVRSYMDMVEARERTLRGKPKPRRPRKDAAPEPDEQR